MSPDFYIGQYQDHGDQYFHDGIDIEKNDGEHVYSVAHGWIQDIKIGAPPGMTYPDDLKRYWYIRITENQNGSGDSWYYGHIEHQSIVGTKTGEAGLKEKDEVELGTFLDNVVDWFGWPDFDHLHLIVEQNGVYINPLSVLSPNTDNTSPTIVENDIDFCRNQTHDFDFETKNGKKVLWGDVDIVANIYDVIPPSSKHVGINKASYQITHDSRNGYNPRAEEVLWDFASKLPPDSDVHNVYHHNSKYNSANDKFYYIVTNYMALDNAGWLTNVKQEHAVTEALKNDEAEYPDGEATFNIKAYDIKENLHSFPTTILLDNFAPLVKSVAIAQNAEIRYDSKEGISKPLGVGEALFTIQFSEPMDTGKTPKITFGLKSPFNQHNLYTGNWSSTDYDNDTYQASFNLPENGGEDYDGLNTLKITAYDLAGNELDKIPASPGRRNDDGGWIDYEEGEDTNHKFYIDTTLPIIKSTDPQNNQTRVDLCKVVTIILEDPLVNNYASGIDPESFDKTKCSIFPSVDGVWSFTGNAILFDPDLF